MLPVPREGTQEKRMQEAGKLKRPASKGGKAGQNSDFSPKTPLIGSSNTVSIGVNGTLVKGLLDSGSMVSTMSQSLVDRLNLPLHPVQDFVTVQGVNGDIIPYRGWVEAVVQLSEGYGKNIPTLFLVVADTSYHQKVPVLLGINFLQVVSRDWKCYKDSGLSKEWHLAMAAVQGKDDLTDAALSLGQVCCKQTVAIAPGQSAEVASVVQVKRVGTKATVVVDDSDVPMPGGLMLLPAVFHLEPGSTHLEQWVVLFNPTGRTVTVPAQSVIADVKLAHVLTGQNGQVGKDGARELRRYL